MFDFIICASANSFRIWLVDRFAKIFLGKADCKKGKNFFICVSFYLINTALFWKFHIAWINIICNLIGIAAIVSLYTKVFRTNVFVTCSIYLLNCACDVVGTALFINYRDGELHSQVYAAIGVFLIFLCELVAEKIITIHKNTETTRNLPLMLVPICSIGMIWFLTYFNGCTNMGIALVSLGLLLLNILMLYLYNLLVHSISQKYETEMLAQKVQIYSNQLNVIRQSEEKMKVLRHDMKHHLNELKLMANRHNIIEMQQYIDRMETSIQNPQEIVASGNLEIDSVLNYMLQKAREELKTVLVKVVLPEEVKHSFDVNVLLGNLLENAIEAARLTEKKYLSVNILLKKGVLRICIENSFITSNAIQEGKTLAWQTTKADKEQHGIGLKSVRKIVEAYDGTMDVTTENDLFNISLILYMSVVK